MHASREQVKSMWKILSVIIAFILIQSSTRYKDKIRANKSLQQASSQRSTSTKTVKWWFGENWNKAFRSGRYNKRRRKVLGT